MKFLLLPAFAAFIAPQLPAQDYDIVFHRAVKPGYRYDIDGTVTDDQAQKIEANGMALRDSVTRTEAILKGRVEVTAVTKHQMPKSVKVEVKEWSLKVAGKAVGSLKAGDLVEGESGGAGSFKVNGNDVTKDEGRALGRLLGLKTEAEPDTDDAVLGAGRRVKSGESWLINATAAAKDLSEAFRSEITPQMLRGTVRFSGLKEGAFSPGQQVEAHITLNRPGMDVPGAPTGTKARSFVVSIDVRTELPVETSLQPRLLEEDMATEVLGESQFNQGGRAGVMTFNLGSRIFRHSVHTPVP